MKILKIKWLRILVTTVTCLVMAYAAVLLDLIYLVPLFFGLSIPITNLDRIRMNKFKAFLISTLLAIPVFFISFFMALGLGDMLGLAGVLFACVFSGVASFLVTMLYIRHVNLKAGLAATALLSLAVPFLATFELQQQLVDNYNTFVIIWQTLVGLGISIGIWTNSERNVSHAPVVWLLFERQVCHQL